MNFPDSKDIIQWDDKQVKEALNLGKICNFDANHAMQVCRLSLIIFDKTKEIHTLDDRERHWLECAAILHDIGWVEGWRGHHKAALRIILNTSMLTYSNRERHIIGSIVRYHRGDSPKKKHAHFAALKPRVRKDVRKLSAILRLANSMDSSHSLAVNEMKVKASGKKLHITCKTDKSHAEEDQKIQSQRDFFTKTYKHKLKVSWENISG
jgi:exopolyphosphatase/guanosine-5'-triphosphate,3'-diphosphate pyrophosphatase